MSPLPAPERERWQPLRLGLIDLFYYDQEELAFRDGRLLLRGNNGTGKSKVLALTLPFLLDGDLSAYRVEPDADPSKRMEWNLLLGGEHPNDERLGRINAVLLSHVHDDHMGDVIQPSANAGACQKPDFSVRATPNSNVANIVLGKQAPLIVGGEMVYFFQAKIKSLGGDPGKRGSVTAACPEALAAGVRPGMDMAEALALSPGAQVRPTRLKRYREVAACLG